VSNAGPISFLLTPIFTSDAVGSTPGAGVLGGNGSSIGIAPTAGSLGLPSTATPATYPLCASLPRDANGQSLVPSAAAFYSIGTDGEVLLSTPLAPSVPGIVCPAGM
jgi:hypothetical protein